MRGTKNKEISEVKRKRETRNAVGCRYESRNKEGAKLAKKWEGNA
jgi:hypothetical protein